MASLTGFIAFMVFVAALFQGTTAQTTHIVGGNLGWRVPQGDTNAYSSWAANQTFKVGDTLVFRFVTGAHNVANVTKTVYDACSTNSAPNAISTGPANMALSEGDNYYICTIGPHCSLGQKVKISVNSSSGTTAPSGAPPGGTTTTPPGGTTTTPKSAASTLTIINFSMLVSVAIAFLC